MPVSNVTFHERAENHYLDSTRAILDIRVIGAQNRAWKDAKRLATLCFTPS